MKRRSIIMHLDIQKLLLFDCLNFNEFVHFLRHNFVRDEWIFMTIIYSNKKETSDFHGTVSFDPAKIVQKKVKPKC